VHMASDIVFLAAAILWVLSTHVARYVLRTAVSFLENLAATQCKCTQCSAHALKVHRHAKAKPPRAQLDAKKTQVPSPLNLQLSTLNPQLFNPQLSTLYPQPSTRNPQPSTLNLTLSILPPTQAGRPSGSPLRRGSG